MEFSDDEEEEVIDLNENYDNDNNNEKTEKTKSSSTKKIKWIKSSLESLSQMARSGFEETEFSEPNEIIKDFFENQVYDNRNDNDEDNKENISDYNNDINENNNNEIKNNNEITEQEKETNMESVPTKNDYTFIWDEGGNTVKLIGSFSKWKQQFPMEKDETNNIFKFNEYPDFTKLTEPNHSEIIGKPFYLNNISKQRKIVNSKYYKFTNNDSYSSSKSYINLSNYRHTILNHITFLSFSQKPFLNHLYLQSLNL